MQYRSLATAAVRGPAAPQSLFLERLMHQKSGTPTVHQAWSLFRSIDPKNISRSDICCLLDFMIPFSEVDTFRTWMTHAKQRDEFIACVRHLSKGVDSLSITELLQGFHRLQLGGLYTESEAYWLKEVTSRRWFMTNHQLAQTVQALFLSQNRQSFRAAIVDIEMQLLGVDKLFEADEVLTKKVIAVWVDVALKLDHALAVKIVKDFSETNFDDIPNYQLIQLLQIIQKSGNFKTPDPNTHPRESEGHKNSTLNRKSVEVMIPWMKRIAGNSVVNPDSVPKSIMGKIENRITQFSATNLIDLLELLPGDFILWKIALMSLSSKKNWSLSDCEHIAKNSLLNLKLTDPDLTAAMSSLSNQLLSFLSKIILMRDDTQSQSQLLKSRTRAATYFLKIANVFTNQCVANNFYRQALSQSIQYSEKSLEIFTLACNVVPHLNPTETHTLIQSIELLIPKDANQCGIFFIQLLDGIEKLADHKNLTKELIQPVTNLISAVIRISESGNFNSEVVLRLFLLGKKVLAEIPQELDKFVDQAADEGNVKVANLALIFDCTQIHETFAEKFAEKFASGFTKRISTIENLTNLEIPENASPTLMRIVLDEINHRPRGESSTMNFLKMYLSYRLGEPPSAADFLAVAENSDFFQIIQTLAFMRIKLDADSKSKMIEKFLVHFVKGNLLGVIGTNRMHSAFTEISRESLNDLSGWLADFKLNNEVVAAVMVPLIDQRIQEDDKFPKKFPGISRYIRSLDETVATAVARKFPRCVSSCVS